MADANQRFLDHLGVSRWHAAGWTGARGLTATAEQIEPCSNHARQAMEVFHLIAPDRRLIYLPTGGSCIGGVYTHKLIDVSLPEILRQGVDTMYASLVDTVCSVAQMDEALAALADSCCLFWAAGKDGGGSRLTTSRYVWGVAAYYLMAGTNDMRPADYSAACECVEFSAPTRINTFPGTSCATPCLCGMAALVNDMAIAVTGRPLPQEGMHRFLSDCAVDIGKTGADVKTGLGAPILPDPETVNIWAYQTKEDIEMYEDDKKIPAWAREDVYYCKEHGLMEGDAEGTFRPDDPVTRAELACTLARLHRDANK